jgi:CBS domain-containing protein
MIKKRIRHLPVIENNKLQGLISIGDVVKAVLDDRDYVIDQLEQYITNRR